MGCGTDENQSEEKREGHHDSEANEPDSTDARHQTVSGSGHRPSGRSSERVTSALSFWASESQVSPSTPGFFVGKHSERPHLTWRTGEGGAIRRGSLVATTSGSEPE